MVNVTQRHRIHRFAAVALLVIGTAGCAGSGRTYSAGRPTFGGRPSIQPGVHSLPGSSYGPQIQPVPQAAPTLSQPPMMQPGPSLPDAFGQQTPRYPESAAARRQPSVRGLPTITPQPEPGTPVATQPQGNRSPASLSGDIEIVPGPSIKAHRARLEILPPPPGEKDESAVEILPSPRGLTVEELPSP